MDCAARIEPGGLDGGAEHFDELVDLFPLARHRRHQLRLAPHFMGQAQVEPEAPGQRQVALLFLVMAAQLQCACGELSQRMARQAQFGPALAGESQLHFFALGVQMGGLELRAEQGLDRGETLGQWLVLGDVAGRIAPHKRQLALAAQQDFTHRQTLGRIGRIDRRGDGLGQQQFDELPVSQRGLQQAQKAFGRIGLDDRCLRFRNQMGEHRRHQRKA